MSRFGTSPTGAIRDDRVRTVIVTVGTRVEWRLHVRGEPVPQTPPQDDWGRDP